jgi:tetratricopeptide (TPR) repeat protein
MNPMPSSAAGPFVPAPSSPTARAERAAPAAAVEAIYATAHWLLGRERPADAAKVFRLLLRMAPRDERGWLGLGECHERIAQPHIALELYGAGSVIAGGERSVSVRCLLARARLLAHRGRSAEAESLLDIAERAALERNDEQLVVLVLRERRELS